MEKSVYNAHTQQNAIARVDQLAQKTINRSKKFCSEDRFNKQFHSQSLANEKNGFRHGQAEVSRHFQIYS